MKLEIVIGIVAGALTAASLLPQLIKMIKERKGSDISIGMLIVLLSGLILWIWYGVLRTDWPIIITNGVSLMLNISIIVLRAYYKKSGR